MWERPLEERMTTQRTQRLEAKPALQGQGDCTVPEFCKQILGESKGKLQDNSKHTVLMQMAEGRAG